MALNLPVDSTAFVETVEQEPMSEPNKGLMHFAVSKMVHVTRCSRKMGRSYRGVSVSTMTKARAAADVVWRALGNGFAKLGRDCSSWANIVDMASSLALASADIDTIEEDAVAGNAAREACDMNFDSHGRAECDVVVVTEAHKLSLADVVHYEAGLLAVPEVAWGDECSSHFEEAGRPPST